MLDAGAVIQVATATSSALVTGTTTIPNDNTIPQNTEGNAVSALDKAFTPKSASSTLIIEALINATHSAANNNIIAALFVDSTANALAAACETHSTGAEYVTLRLRAVISAGSTSARTYKIRVGGSAAGTTSVNGQSGAATMGGVLASSMTITEVAA